MAYNYSGQGYQEQPDKKQIPEGDQVLEITGAVEGASKKGAPMVTITLALADNTECWPIKHYICLNNEWTAQNVGRLLAACGRNPKQDGLIDFGSFRGCRVRARIVNEVYDGKMYPKVKYFHNTLGTDAPPMTEAKPTAGDIDDSIPF